MLEQSLTEDQRLVMIRALLDTANHTLNDSMLNEVLAMYGHNLSRDKVRGQIRWLEDMDLVSMNTIGQKTLVATLTERGGDVAKGLACVDGVKKPAPGSYNG